MRVAFAFILLISLAIALPIEKERLVYEDEPDKQAVVPDENEENSKVQSVKKRFFFGQNRRYCCSNPSPPCHITPPDCFGPVNLYGNTPQGNYWNTGGNFRSNLFLGYGIGRK